MHKSTFLLGTAATLAACGQAGPDPSTNNLAANSAATEKPKPAYCFFKEGETKDWKAEVDKDGNVVVSGKAYRSDPRYKAELGPASVSGSSAEIAPTLTVNGTGYAAPENVWDVKATIPQSRAVTSVTVRCGDKMVAKLDVPRKG